MSESKRGITVENAEFYNSGGRICGPESIPTLALSELGAESASEAERDARDAIQAEIVRLTIKARADELLEQAQEAGKELPLSAAQNQARYEFANGDLEGYKPTLIIASNAGSYSAIAKRTRALQRDGVCLLDAEVRARAEAADGTLVDVLEKTDCEKDAEYMGAPTSELMKAPVGSGGHSGGGSKGLSRKKVVRIDRSTAYDEILADDGHGRSSFVGARVSAETKEVLSLGGLQMSAGEIVERVVQAAIAVGAGPKGIQAMLSEMEQCGKVRKAS